jgi:gliding motility-associated-like protein
MHNIKLYITALFILLKTISFAQNRNNVWYFGDRAGISFNTTPPTVLTDGVNTHAEGVSSICNSAGDLLFYTNGINVWDANLNVMPNGVGLLGNNSSSQILIVPKPGDCDIYYIFTTPSQTFLGGLYYSVIDMRLNNGNGDLTNRNILIANPTTERVTATLKDNGTDYWVVTQELGSNAFLSFSVTSAGVDFNPVISNVGVDNLTVQDVIGCLKISPNGTKLGCTSEIGHRKCQLFDFDNNTGIVSNGFILSDTAAYGMEFSTDNSKLYLARYGQFRLTQYDLSSNNATTIKNSEFLINATSSELGGALQLGPDGKIYIARSGKQSLDVINNPNALGASCSYTNNAISLNGKVCAAGLPNLINKYNGIFCGGLRATYTHTTLCANNDVKIVVNASFGSAPYKYSIDGVVFQSSNIFTNLPNADYTITVLDANLLERKVNLSVPKTNSISLAIFKTRKPDCGLNNGNVELRATNGVSPFLYSKDGVTFQTDSLFTNLSIGLVTFTVKDAIGCTDTKILNLTTLNNLKINAGRDTGIFINQGIKLFAKDLTNSNFISYKWEPNYKLNDANIQNPTAIIDKDIDYFVTATNQVGCTATDTIHIDVYKEIGIFVPTAFSPNNDYKNDILHAVPRGMKQLNYFKIFNRFGQVVFYSNIFANGWDGNINGVRQNTGSYIWIAEGIDIKGNVVSRKGYFTLVR